MQVNTTYRSSDLVEICFLMANSVPVLNTKRDCERVIFVFDDSDGRCGSLVNGFILGRDSASASRLFQERTRVMKIIKTAI